MFEISPFFIDSLWNRTLFAMVKRIYKSEISIKPKFARDNPVPATQATRITFQINNAKLYIPVVIFRKAIVNISLDKLIVTE